MASGQPEETRAYARLPGLDIAVLHRGPGCAGEGEQVTIAMRTAPSFAALGRPVSAVDPFLLWMGLAQAAWTSWLGCVAAASASRPWVGRGD